MTRNQEIHSKLGPAFMYTNQVVAWLENREHRMLAKQIEYLYGETIGVNTLKEYLHNHGYNAQSIVRLLECDVTQYQNFK